jgi:hypothetical protein
MHGEIIRAGRPKQGITVGQNYWPWQCKKRQRSHEGVRAGMTQEKRYELWHYGMWSSSRRSKGGSKPPCFKFSTTGPSKCAWVGKACRAVDRRARGRERASEARLLGDLSRTGREERREWEKEKLGCLGCAACRLLLDRFSGGFGGTGWLAGRPSPGTKKRRGKTTNEFFQNLPSFPNSGKTSLLNKQTNK